ncbi:response regulator transcription factor [Kribbella albertanoniae]
MPTGRGTFAVNQAWTEVLIVAPNRLVRDGVQTLVEEQDRFRVAGAVENIAAAAVGIRSGRTDVVLVDTAYHAGITRLLQGRDTASKLKVVALVTGDCPPVKRLREYFAAGLDGIVSSADDITVGLVAVRSGLAPDGWISPTIGAEILRDPPPAPEPPERLLEAITPSEYAVLKLVADGHTDREIGRLQRSERVVKYHVSNLLSKLHARNRAHVVKLAVRTGLLAIPCPSDQG